VRPPVLLAKIAEHGARHRDAEVTATLPEPTPVVPPAIDFATLLALEPVMPGRKLRDFVAAYLDFAGERLAGLASAGDDLAALARESHMLVGAAGNLGASRVCAAGRALEQAARADDTAATAALYEALVVETSAASAALADWLEQQRQSSAA
jgi:HPt (histidine-containing phosphotransfer) domain-containing protein